MTAEEFIVAQTKLYGDLCLEVAAEKAAAEAARLAALNP